MKITKRQLRRIIREAIDPREMEEPLGGWAGDALANDPDYSPRAYEDNQTKMVRRYLALRGEEEKVERMSVGEIESLAADLRLLPPSTKKRWGIYDLREAYGGAKGPFPDRYGTAPKATTPEVFADQNGLQLELDNEGQKIIYVDNEQADRLDMPPGVSWDAQQNYDGKTWTIYTGEYE